MMDYPASGVNSIEKITVALRVSVVVERGEVGRLG